MGSLLSIVYMFQMYRRRIASKPEEEEDSGIAVQGVAFILAVVLIGIGVYPEPLINLIQVASESIPRGFAP